MIIFKTIAGGGSGHGGGGHSSGHTTSGIAEGHSSYHPVFIPGGVHTSQDTQSVMQQPSQPIKEDHADIGMFIFLATIALLGVLFAATFSKD